MSERKKVRVELRKNRSKPPRDKRWTREFHEHGFAEAAPPSEERVRAKGELSRRRTIVAAGDQRMPAIDPSTSRRGRVLRIHGLHCIVEADDGSRYRCAVRRLLKTLTTDERNIVATGDVVWFRPSPVADRSAAEIEGLIERIEPRHGLLTRESRGREHVLVANVDQVVIVMSILEPELKPHLIDRYLASAQLGGLDAVLCLNKCDLVPAELMQPILGSYAQLGVPTLLTSAITGTGIEDLRERLRGRVTAFAGQSGVGKSTLLNALEPGLALRVRDVSTVNQKGRHTTTTAEIHKLSMGGWVVDTPGVRQLQLASVQPEQVEALLPEFVAFVTHCAFKDCTHIHETGCHVLRAVNRHWISERRYASYVGMVTGLDPSAP